MGIVLLMSLVWAVHTKMNVWNGFSYTAEQADAIGITELLLGIMIYLTVYADEFSSNSMQCLIGRGISRFKLLAAKCIDCGIITAVSFGVYTIWVLLLGLVLGAHMNGTEAVFLCTQFLVAGVKTFGFATLAMIVLYATKNVSYATVANVLLIVASDLFLAGFHKIPGIKFMHWDNKIFSGAVECAGIDLQLSGGGALATILWDLGKVVVVSLLLSYLFFRRKELDF